MLHVEYGTQSLCTRCAHADLHTVYRAHVLHFCLPGREPSEQLELDASRRSLGSAPPPVAIVSVGMGNPCSTYPRSACKARGRRKMAKKSFLQQLKTELVLFDVRCSSRRTVCELADATSIFGSFFEILKKPGETGDIRAERSDDASSQNYNLIFCHGGESAAL